MPTPKSVTKYLDRYAEPECRSLSGFPEISVDHILVVPFYRETTAFPERLLRSELSQKPLLVIAVVNQPHGPEEPLNRSLANFFLLHEAIWRNGTLTLCRASNSGLHWLMVDRFTQSNTLDPQQGVGHARKLGSDLAALLIERGHCADEWIYTTDADAHLPANYFSTSIGQHSSRTSAAVFPIKHIATSETSTAVYAATCLYEEALDYYVHGLRWAGSPYAFPTVGSAMAVRAKAYCEARGFPKKAGGEDFYLLNKLAKLGTVSYVKDIVIRIECRVSTRVPFGTGPTVEKILSLKNPTEDYLYYAPEIFQALRQWIFHMPQVWSNILEQKNPLDPLPDFIQSALRQSRIEDLWVHIRRQIHSATECEHVIHRWFDAFQTLKFIRRLQEIRYAPYPLSTCVQRAPFMQECVR